VRPIARWGAAVGGGIVRSIATVALVAGAGCADTGAFAGRWEGRYDLPAPPGSDPAIAETLANVRLEVLRDGTFTLREEGFVKEGVWSVSGTGLALEIRTTLGRPIDPESGMGGTRRLSKSPEGLELQRDGYPDLVLRPAQPREGGAGMP
jgi:hypothetical protein